MPREDSSPKITDMSFLQTCALEREYLLSETEQETVKSVSQALQEAEAVIIHLGGKAGRLGECVVGTALLEGTLQALRSLDKAGLPLTIMVDEGSKELFSEKAYREKYWDAIAVIPVPLEPTPEITEIIAHQTEKNKVLTLDFHGKNDGMPYLQITANRSIKNRYQRRVDLKHLFRVGVRCYAHRGPERRYADFLEHLFGLSQGSLDGLQVQPKILLTEDDDRKYPLLARAYDLNEDAMQVMCFFQSMVVAKCYGKWDEVMMQLCDYLAHNFPQQKIDFLLACGPDEQQPEGLSQEDLAEEFNGFTGINHNARVLVDETPSLRDLAIVTKRATLVMSNDTGPSHIAGALQIPTIVPYLPGNIYSRKVWSSTLWHRGVTLEPSPFSFRQIEAAILWNRTEILNDISSQCLGYEVLKSLPPEFQVSQ